MTWIRQDGKSKTGSANGWSKGSSTKPICKKDNVIKTGKVKLTWEDVDKIRLESNQGVKSSKLAKRYQVSGACIYNIIKNKTWKKVVG